MTASAPAPAETAPADTAPVEPAPVEPAPVETVERRGPSDDERAGRILDAMEAHLCRGGIRAVVMSELAAELGMSTKTLYRAFPSKDALVRAVVERWAERLLAAQQRRRDSAMSAAERVRTGARFLLRHRERMSAEFWADLEADHPEAWARYRGLVDDARHRSDAWMARAVHDGVDVQVARALLVASIERALDPALRRSAGLGRDEAIDLACDIWSRGVFAAPDAPPPPED